MGSVGFHGEVESQPSTNICNKEKLPTTLHVGCGAVNHASVPRKLRSAIKKLGRESTTPPLSISKNQCRLSNRVGTLKKEGGKKTKQKRKQGHITKDEEEVAETLYDLANMFSVSDTANQLGLNDKSTDTKSTVVIEAGRPFNAIGDTGLLIPREKSRKISSKVSTCKENLLDSKSQFVKLKSSGGGKKTMFSSKQSSPAGGSRVKSISFLPPRLPAWFNNTNLTPQTKIMENCTNTEKCFRAVVQSKKTWKRSSTHVYIGRLIKVLQLSDGKEESPEKRAQLTNPGGDHQTTTINDILRHKTLIQDCQLASETSASCSAKEGYDFLSMGTKVGGVDTNVDVNRAGHTNEALKQFQALYMQSQNHSGMLFSLPRNVYSSTLHDHNSALGAQAQVPQYLTSSTVNGSFMAAQMVNNGQALFPHFLGYSNCPQLSHPQPMSVSSHDPLQNVKMN